MKIYYEDTYACAYHDLWGTFDELVEHYNENNQQCTILREVNMKETFTAIGVQENDS